MKIFIPPDSDIHDLGRLQTGSGWLVDSPTDLASILSASFEFSEHTHRLHEIANVDFDFKHWATVYEETPASFKDWREFDPDSGEGYDLPYALSITHQLFAAANHASDYPEGLQGKIHALVVFSDNNDDVRIDINEDQAALVFSEGSVNLSIASAFFKAVKLGKWAVMLYIAWNKGISPSDWGKHLADQFRKKKEEDGTCFPLKAISELQDNELKDSYAVIIFFHGLLATDLGTFDHFIELIMKNNVFEKNVALVGFPHDTLSSIEINAHELHTQINRVLASKAKLAFVCHSRGGLLARQTAVRLYDDPRSNWKDRLQCCVTFGTPHEGAKLAEAPERLIAITSVGLSTMQGGYTVWPQALACVAAGHIQGVLDLQGHFAKDGQFLRQLYEREISHCTAPDQSRLLEILAFGGKVVDKKFQRLAISKLIQSDEHDLVVRLTSSTPKSTKPHTVTCNHFEYFESTQDRAHEIAKNCLYDCLDLSTKEAEEFQKSLNSDGGGIVKEKDRIIINGIPLDKKN